MKALGRRVEERIEVVGDVELGGDDDEVGDEVELKLKLELEMGRSGGVGVAGRNWVGGIRMDSCEGRDIDTEIWGYKIM